MPKKYQLIVYTVEAIQITPESVDRAAVWCGGLPIKDWTPGNKNEWFTGLNVPTLMGVQRASEGDYVVKEATGNFDVVKKREFEAKYELAS